MKHLAEVSLGIRWQTLGNDKDYPPVASPATADHTAFTMDMLQASFDAPPQTLVHLGPAIRGEQDPTLAESVSRDLLPGAPLHATAPTSALR